MRDNVAMSEDRHDVEALGAYALGVLDERESHAVDRHLVDCAQCQLELAGLREAVDTLDELPPEMLLDGPPEDGDSLLQRILDGAAAEGATPAVAGPGRTAQAGGSYSANLLAPHGGTSGAGAPGRVGPVPPGGRPFGAPGASGAGPAPARPADLPTDLIRLPGRGGTNPSAAPVAPGPVAPGEPVPGDELAARRARRRKFGGVVSVAAAAAAVAGLGGGVVLGRGTAPQVAAPASTVTAPPATTGPAANARVLSATDDATGARINATITPAAGWVRVNAAVTGIPAGQRCLVVVTDKRGQREIAGGWLVSPEGAKSGSVMEGSALVAPADLASISVQSETTGSVFVTAKA
jgi:hypothetical protein